MFYQLKKKFLWLKKWFIFNTFREYIKVGPNYKSVKCSSIQKSFLSSLVVNYNDSLVFMTRFWFKYHEQLHNIWYKVFNLHYKILSDNVFYLNKYNDSIFISIYFSWNFYYCLLSYSLLRSQRLGIILTEKMFVTTFHFRQIS